MPHRARPNGPPPDSPGAITVPQSFQEEHHRKRTYQEELRLMLERHGIEYDERYVWD